VTSRAALRSLSPTKRKPVPATGLGRHRPHVDATTASTSAASPWAALDEVSDIVCVTTLDGTLRFLNRAARDLLAFVDEAQIADTLFPMHTIAARELLFDEVVPAALEKGRATSDTALQSADGRVFQASQTVIVAPATPEREPTLTIIIRDLSVERMSAARLSDSHRLFETIARRSPDLTFLYDPRSERILWTNRCAHAFLGAPERDARTLNRRELLRLLHRDDRAPLAATAERMAAAYGDHDTLSAEVRMRSGRGTWRWIHMRASVFSRRESGEPSLLLGIATDISNRKRSEQRLSDACETAERAAVDATQLLRDLAVQIASHTAQLAALASSNGAQDNVSRATLTLRLRELHALGTDALIVAGNEDTAQASPPETTDISALIVGCAASLGTRVRVALALPTSPSELRIDSAAFAAAITDTLQRQAERRGTIGLQISLHTDDANLHPTHIEITREVPAGAAPDAVPSRSPADFGHLRLRAQFERMGCVLEPLASPSGTSDGVVIRLPVPSRSAALAAAFPVHAALV
jgi:PAS domain S-box-containing protein